MDYNSINFQLLADQIAQQEEKLNRIREWKNHLQSLSEQVEDPNEKYVFEWLAGAIENLLDE